MLFWVPRFCVISIVELVFVKIFPEITFSFQIWMEMVGHSGTPQKGSEREMLWIWVFAARLFMAPLKERKTHYHWLAASASRHSPSLAQLPAHIPKTEHQLICVWLIQDSHWWVGTISFLELTVTTSCRL